MPLTSIVLANSTLASKISTMLSFVKYVMTLGRTQIRRFQIYSGKDYFLARTTCVTQNSLASLPIRCYSLHFREMRIDGINDFFSEKFRNPPLSYGKFLSPRLSERLAQQNLFFLNKSHPPRFIIIDSFPELAVQKFAPPNSSTYFFSYASLVDQQALEKGKLSSHGLLPIDRIEPEYEIFFMNLLAFYPSSRIIFIHYPHKFELREVFLERARVIRGAISRIAKCVETLSVLDVPLERVEKRQGDPSPYHFSNETYRYIRDQLSSMNAISDVLRETSCT